MIIFIIFTNSDIDVLFSISNSRSGLFFKIHSKYYPRKKFTKFEFRELMEWFSVILISSAFSSVPELDSRRRIPLASSWHNDSLTKVSRKRFQNHRKLIQTHPNIQVQNRWFLFKNDSKSTIFNQKFLKFWIFWNWVEQLESYDGKSTGSDPGASYRKLKKQNFCWNHDYIEKKPLKPMLKKYQGRNRFVEL